MAKFKIYAFILMSVILALVIYTPVVSAQDVQNFKINNFDADYFLNRNAQKTSVLNVIERITAQFPNYDQNHGILRAIPKSYQGHTVSLSIESVKDGQGQKRDYSTYTENDNLVLKIGDEDRFVHGSQEYVIRYTVRNVILFLNDHDEFYWDINGDQWIQKFDRVVARIHIPKSLSLALQDRLVCYAGRAGENSSKNCVISGIDNGSEIMITASTRNGLRQYETLTTVLGFNKGIFELGPEVAKEKRLNQLILAGKIAAVAVPTLAAAAFMFRRWRQFGNDPKGRGVIIPEYEPPKGLDVLSSDYLLSQKLRNPAISAAIIDLAVRRYVTIYEIKLEKRLRRDTIDYELVLAKGSADLNDNYKDVIGMLFGDQMTAGSTVKISDFNKSAAKSAAKLKKIQQLDKSVPSRLSSQNYFIKNPANVKQGYLGWAMLILILAGAILVFHIFAFLSIGLLVAAFVVIAFAFIMPARTEKGVLAHDALLGLKDYIRLAEADRLKFLQSPNGSEKIAGGSFNPKDPKMQVKLFESLLPYAMMFGLEKQWAEQFKTIYTTPPDWYRGNWAAFNTGYLAGSIGGFSNASSLTFVSPSSSSSSGFSGGSSGGGGGGGGGGGW